MKRITIAALGLAILVMATAAEAAAPRSSRGGVGAPDPRDPVSRVLRFRGEFHSVGQLLLHSSNMGVFGRYVSTPGGLIQDRTRPSAEWPAGSGNNYLWSAGLWVGAIRAGGDTLVTSAVYQAEFWPALDDPVDIIYKSFEGRPGGGRNRDDDGDGRTDEEQLDGRDNDGDGLVDEDYAAISQEMFAATYYDTATFLNAYITDTVERHRPLGLKIFEESYQFTGKRFDDFVGISYRIVNMNPDTLKHVYVGFMVDSDNGPDIFEQTPGVAADDQARFVEIDTTFTPVGSTTAIGPLKITMGYMYDEVGGADGSNAAAGLGVMFLGHTTDATGVDAPEEVRIHSYKNWSISGEDPQSDGQRYQYMRGNSDDFPTIDEDTDQPQDYRYMVSAGPFARIAPQDTLTFDVAFVAGPITRSPVQNEPPLKLDFMENAIYAQIAFDGPAGVEPPIHWVTASPPPPPNQRVDAGDGRVTIEWDDFPESVPDPLTTLFDFAGYQIWKAVGWDRTSPSPSNEQWRLVADIPRSKLPLYSTGLSGTGRYRFVDQDVHNGYPYWFAVTGYDTGAGQDGVPLFGSPSQAQVLVWPRSGVTKGIDRGVSDPVNGQTGKVLVVPNPYKEREAWDLAETQADPSGRRVCFMNLPEQATIRIYTESGDVVETLVHDRTSDEPGETCWNLVSRNNQEVVSGTYLYHVESPQGEATGRFVVIR